MNLKTSLICDVLYGCLAGLAICIVTFYVASGFTLPAANGVQFVFTRLPDWHYHKMFFQQRLHRNLAEKWMSVNTVESRSKDDSLEILKNELTAARQKTEQECQLLDTGVNPDFGGNEWDIAYYIPIVLMVVGLYGCWLRNLFVTRIEQSDAPSLKWLAPHRGNRLFASALTMVLLLGLIVTAVDGLWGWGSTRLDLSYHDHASLQQYVGMPDGMDPNEWLKVCLFGDDLQRALAGSTDGKGIYSQPNMSGDQMVAAFDKYVSGICEQARSKPNEFLMPPPDEVTASDRFGRGIVMALGMAACVLLLLVTYDVSVNQLAARLRLAGPERLDAGFRVVMLVALGLMFPGIQATSRMIGSFRSTGLVGPPAAQTTPREQPLVVIPNSGTATVTVSPPEPTAADRRISLARDEIRRKDQADWKEYMWTFNEKRLKDEDRHLSKLTIECEREIKGKLQAAEKKDADAKQLRHDAFTTELKGQGRSDEARAARRARADRLNRQASDCADRARSLLAQAELAINSSDKRSLANQAEEQLKQERVLRWDAESDSGTGWSSGSGAEMAHQDARQLRSRAGNLESEAAGLRSEIKGIQSKIDQYQSRKLEIAKALVAKGI